jgi:hypothetical protein
MLGMSNARRDINSLMTPLTHSFQMILLRTADGTCTDGQLSKRSCRLHIWPYGRVSQHIAASRATRTHLCIRTGPLRSKRMRSETSVQLRGYNLMSTGIRSWLRKTMYRLVQRVVNQPRSRILSCGLQDVQMTAGAGEPDLRSGENTPRSGRGPGKFFLIQF